MRAMKRNQSNVLNTLYAALRSDRKKRMLAALVACIAVFSLMILTDAPGDTVDDDWLIACYLSPTVPDGDLCLFINAALAQFISHLGDLLPYVNCFQTFELIVSFVALFCFAYYAIKYLKLQYGLFLLCGFILFSLPGCTYLQKFTIVAGTVAIIGFFLLVISFYEDDAVAGVVGCVLIVLGVMLRQDAVLIGVPFFVGITLFAFLRFSVKDERAPSMRRLIVFMLAVLVICLALNLYDDRVWAEPPWSDWSAYNSVRSAISDFPVPPYDEVAAELSEIGFSENDYAMMKNWMVSDTNVFSLEKMREVALLQDAYQDPSAETVLYKTISALCQEPALIMMIVMALVFFFIFRCNDRLAWTALVVSFVGSFFICIYFQWLGRLLTRIYYLVWLNFLFSSVLILHCARIGKEGSRYASSISAGLAAKRIASTACVVICAGLVLQAYVPVALDFNILGFMNYSVQQPGSDNYLNLYRDVQHINEGSTRFVYQARARKILERSYGLKTIPNAQYYSHNIALGEWAVESPQLKSIYGEIEWENPYEGLLNDENAVLVVTDEKYADMTRTFLSEHYDPEVAYAHIGSTVAYGTELHLYQFSTRNQAGDAMG